MGVLADWQIDDLAVRGGMIEPFAPQQVRERRGERIVSYGLSSYGYDARLAGEFKLPHPAYQVTTLDPHDVTDEEFITVIDNEVVVPPNQYVLGRTLERFKVPRDVLVFCLGKSTYARSGIIVNVTPLEPEWEGHVTLEISNTSSRHVKVYANEGIAQFVFVRADLETCRVSYADKGGKYQGQNGITLPKV